MKFVILLAAVACLSLLAVPPATAIGETCGGMTGLLCAEGEYCRQPDGHCINNTGTCELKAEICTMEYDPVCGCDGKTYGNDCSAAAAGVSIAGQGECDDASSTASATFPSVNATGDTCGGVTNITCQEGEYCRQQEGVCVNISDGTGTCEPRPEACTMQYDPVCGCDGKTHGNSCTAAASGVSIAYQGECGDSFLASSAFLAGATCGGIADIPCPEGEYCRQQEGDCIDIKDGTGTCEPKPEVCTMQYDPVCGCDGKTHGNSCVAAASGVSIAKQGKCDSDDTSSASSALAGHSILLPVLFLSSVVIINESCKIQ